MAVAQVPFVVDCEDDKQVPAVEYCQNIAGTKHCGMEYFRLLRTCHHSLSLSFFSKLC